MSPGERERVVNELHAGWCVDTQGEPLHDRSEDCRMMTRLYRAYDAGASRLDEVEAENERLRVVMEEYASYAHTAQCHPCFDILCAIGRKCAVALGRSVADRIDRERVCTCGAKYDVGRYCTCKDEP